ncbi:hypothetical protein DTW90_36020 [Neorhizobium sp. P12A]|uniref:hypothetical protein n=1 Tax=Neorhizobium sp. P12A TaxID=2268027 RepID=UPI0011ED87C6|nr:hypothetical protein [Neorhizobium sp. P12A]KAA0684549.1 hypothetical protein DTW90_36020 [Neorhizobium sp. P12A]
MQSSSPQLISIVLRNDNDAERLIAAQREKGLCWVSVDRNNLIAPSVRLTFVTIEAFRPKGATLQ